MIENGVARMTLPVTRSSRAVYSRVRCRAPELLAHDLGRRYRAVGRTNLRRPADAASGSGRVCVPPAAADDRTAHGRHATPTAATHDHHRAAALLLALDTILIRRRHVLHHHNLCTTKEDAAEAVLRPICRPCGSSDADLVELVERELTRTLNPIWSEHRSPSSPTAPSRPLPSFGVFGIFGQMRALGVPADRAAYNALINARARGRHPRAEGAFSEMLAAGINPDAISFSSLIKACAVAGDSQRADSIFTEMQQRTNHFSTYTPPSSHTRPAHLMAVHRRAGQPERVLELLDEMSNSTDLKLRVVHFSLALQALSLWKDLPLSLRAR